jgi:NitT/TauT family transport system substrate-binding protein
MPNEIAQRPTKRRLLAPVVVISAAAGLALASCSSSPSSSSPSSSSSASPKTLTAMTIGVQAPLPIFTPFFVIQENPGICAPYGVDPSFATVNPVSGPPALLSGSVPLQVESNGSFFEEAAKSPSSITLLGGYGPIAADYWVTKDVHTLKDLAGKTLAATTPGGASDLLARLVIQLAGLTAGTGSGDVHIDYVGSAQAIIALTTTGRTAGFSDPPPLPAPALAAGIHSIANLTLYPQAIPLDSLAVVVSGPYYQSHKAAVHGMLECIAHADVYAKANSAAAESAIEKVLNEPASYATAAYAGNKSTWNIYPFTTSLAAAALKDLQTAGFASQVKGYSSSSDDTTALAGISGALTAPPGTSIYAK